MHASHLCFPVTPLVLGLSIVSSQSPLPLRFTESLSLPLSGIHLSDDRNSWNVIAKGGKFSEAAYECECLGEGYILGAPRTKKENYELQLAMEVFLLCSFVFVVFRVTAEVPLGAFLVLRRGACPHS